ncbi:hypothetical protein KC19_3G184800 [Ceratodon purpureus]|uniref:serine C-palmitoyltransferase n=1 Tax=Ceratodon purpureus TaxID=3225 RepID=A0A8T0IMD6_CERPU|nr:hypothetical protein KC19_3G184800 [Ceratodon purpureus]KAG0584098.1 hypothetical protein KC19_3G184800 [Ceratodon purpureus]KAG0584099.1 hypothetical protein KC19_3G184800 [Ceratodon purpureus]KAG0584100.1 hypothetical protein KC19_3G184800 [Ceratodon purpureus]
MKSTSTYLAFLTLIGYVLVFLAGKWLDLIQFFKFNQEIDSRKKGYAPLSRDLEDFYIRRMYTRVQECFNRPIASAPDTWMDVIERVSCDRKTLIPTKKTRRCLNLGSYNYLGFAAKDVYCTPNVVESIEKFGVSTCASRVDCGTNILHLALEELIAKFVGKPAAMVYGMGFATNSSTIPALVGKGGLIVSDKLNHSSIVVGAKASGANVKVFDHNSPSHLEKVLREAIVKGQPLTHRPWKKILVIVEGIYSMEGEICRLREIVAVTKRYKAYLYLDEAHSIGAIGKTGRGVCELQGVNIDDVHVVMGTFTKSFGSCGGYIAGSKELIHYIKSISPAHLYASSMPPPVAEQVISALKVTMGEDGTDRGIRKITAVRENSNYFREELRKMGCEVLGDEDSPVMPIMLYIPAKIAAFSNECLQRNVAVVSVGFPATHFLFSRARICISAAHTRDDLDQALQVISEVCDICQLKYNPPLRLTAKELARLAEKERLL